MIKNVFILGDHIQALGISRIVHKLGYKVVLFSRYNISITRFSNTVTKFVLYKDDQDLYNKLCSLSKGDRNTVLIPTNDMLVEFIHDHFDQLNLLYYLSTAAPEVLEICSNKKNTYNKAKELNVPIPFSIFPENEEEVKKIAFEKVAQVRIYQLYLIIQIIDLAYSRGAFKGAEASQIGAIYDSFLAGVNKAFEVAEEEIKKAQLAEQIPLNNQVP